MKNNEYESQLYKFKSVLPYYLTIQITILLITLLQITTTITFYNQLGYQPIDGWFGLWIILEVVGFSVGLILWLLKPWRKEPMSSRINLIFGYFGGVWVGLVSIIFHYAMAPLYSFITAGIGFGWLILFVLIRNNKHRSEEIFP
jgi:uncharacterized YccA/Bax inhibitor family protein